MSEPAPHDPEFLREHREKLLARQGLRTTDFTAAIFGGATYRELIVAIIYSIVGLGLCGWVLWLGHAVDHLLTAAILMAPVVFFVFLFWSNYFLTRRKSLRARAYEGVLEDKTRGELSSSSAAVFEGGRVVLPPRILNELVPGVRYRIHAAGTDEVAVDVALDEEEEKRRGAYR